MMGPWFSRHFPGEKTEKKTGGQRSLLACFEGFVFCVISADCLGVPRHTKKRAKVVRYVQATKKGLENRYKKEDSTNLYQAMIRGARSGLFFLFGAATKNPINTNAAKM